MSAGSGGGGVDWTGNCCDSGGACIASASGVSLSVDIPLLSWQR